MISAIFLPAFLLSFSSCLDNIVIGVAYGMKKTAIPFTSNLIIAIISSLGTLISMLFGKLLSSYISVYLSKAIGSSMIIIIGIYFILECFIKMNMCENSIDKVMINNIDESDEHDIAYHNKNLNHKCPYKQNKMSIRESLILAFALTINNLGLGLSASLSGVNINLTVLLTFIISLITIVIGVSMGRNFIGRLLGRFASLASGILMLILGIIELF